MESKQQGNFLRRAAQTHGRECGDRTRLFAWYPHGIVRKTVAASWSITQYDVSADGKRFVTLDRMNEQPLLIHVVHNWFEEFRGR